MANTPLKIMISSSVYGSLSLLRQTYSTLRGFGYKAICSPVGSVAVNPKKPNLKNCLDAALRNAKKLAFENKLDGQPRRNPTRSYTNWWKR
jgi:hypothetical protein